MEETYLREPWIVNRTNVKSLELFWYTTAASATPFGRGQEAAVPARNGMPRAGGGDAERHRPLTSSPMRNFFYYIEYLSLRLLAECLNLLPIHRMYRLADAAGDLIFFLLRRKREMALENLRAAFGREKTDEEIVRTARDSFRNVIKLGFEFIRIPKLCRDIEERVDLINISLAGEILWKSLHQGKGVVMLVSHLGNWEISGLRFIAAGYPMHAIGRPLKNPYVYRYIKKLRGFNGLKTVDKKGALREVVKQIKRNQIICVLVDQRETQGGVEVDFFGRKAWTGTLPAVLALKYDVALVPIECRREAPNHWSVRISEPIEIVRTGNFEEDVRVITQRYTHTIEEQIRRDPAAWLWMHNRWRGEHKAKN